MPEEFVNPYVEEKERTPEVEAVTPEKHVTPAGRWTNPYIAKQLHETTGRDAPVAPMWKEPVHVKDEADYQKVEPGLLYIGPDGRRRQKPWVIKTADDYKKIPEGEDYLDPEGKRREKTKYEGVGFTTQTLYDMAYDDKERKKALERAYPGQVKVDAGGEMYVETPEGKRLKPGHGSELSRLPAFLTSQAAPIGGAVLGAIGAGPFGALGGAVGGQALNDAAIGFLGIYDRTPLEEGVNLLKSGALSVAGYGVGRGVMKAAAPIMAATKQAAAGGAAVVPAALAWAWGVDPGKLRQAIDLTKQGATVTARHYATEAPLLDKIEQFDQAFRKVDDVFEGARHVYEQEGRTILASPQIGTTSLEDLTAATARVSSEPAGTKVLQSLKDEVERNDYNLLKEVEKERELVQRTFDWDTSPAYKDQLKRLEYVYNESINTAQKVVDKGFSYIQSSINRVMRRDDLGFRKPGDMQRLTAGLIEDSKNDFRIHSNTYYKVGDELAGKHIPRAEAIEGLSTRAQSFLESVPDEFAQLYPSIVQDIKGLAGEVNAAGEMIKPPVYPTWSQLHQLRSFLRHEVDWTSLNHNVREGTFKALQEKVDAVIHDIHAIPELKAAAKALDRADKFYADNIKRFQDATVRQIVAGVRAGIPADPGYLAKMLFAPGRTEMRNEVKKMVGEGMWSAVRAADKQNWLNGAWDELAKKYDAQSLAKGILERAREGILDEFKPATREVMVRQAQRIQRLEGKLDVALDASDPVAVSMARAEAAANDITRLAKEDPIKALNLEMERLNAFEKQSLRDIQADESKQALGPYYQRARENGTALAMTSADEILKSPDLNIAVEQKFGSNSAEFNALRSVYVHRLLQSTRTAGGEPIISSLTQKLEMIDPKIQNLMFPGMTLSQIKTLAKNMDFLLGGSNVTDMGGSLAAASRVLKPGQSVPIRSGAVRELLNFPGVSFATRMTLGKLYRSITNLTGRQGFLEWMEKGLNSGNPIRMQEVKEAFNNAAKVSQPLGAGAGVEIGEMMRGGETPQRPAGFPPNARRGLHGKYYVPNPDSPSGWDMIEPIR